MKTNRRLGLARTAVFALSLCSFLAVGQADAQRGEAQITAEQSAMIDDMISRMTLAEKAGQMTQITLEAITSQNANGEQEIRLDPEKVRSILVDFHVGSILNTATVSLDEDTWREVVAELQRVATEETRLGVPLIYGIDSVHGANYINDATIFPHNLTLGSTWEPELSREAGRITAEETRSVGLTWNFSPVADIKRHPAWSRVFETFGEDPMLAGAMAAANIEGQQGDDLTSPATVAATAKHFLGYSGPRSGRDRTPAYVSPAELADTYLPPFQDAFDVNVRTIMINSGEMNGVPVHADERILTDLLRDELGYRGVAVTDWADVVKLENFHHIAANEREAVYLAVTAGIDMAMTPMTPSFATELVQLVEDGKIPESRLDESVRRILALKAELGLFGSVMPSDDDRLAIGTAEGAELSLNAARRGITLLRNRNDLLPLDSDTKLLVTGPAADNLVALHGAWTYDWQGTNPSLYPDTPTIVDGLRMRFGAGNVEHVGVDGFETPADLDAAVAAAQGSDVIIVCVGEQPSTEQPGDIGDLLLSSTQLDLVRALAETGKPVVMAIVTNRPRIITPVEDLLAGVIWLGHPGPHGPTALAEILAGDVNPSGRLSFTYPKFVNHLTTYDHKRSEGYEPLFAFGEGIGYTTFGYESMNVRVPGSFPESGEIRVDVPVTNTGDVAGADVVKVYVTDEVASVTPRVTRLRGFQKVDLEPGETKTVTIRISASDLAAPDRDGNMRFEPGDFTFRVGEMTRTLRLPEGGPASVTLGE